MNKYLKLSLLTLAVGGVSFFGHRQWTSYQNKKILAQKNSIKRDIKYSVTENLGKVLPEVITRTENVYSIEYTLEEELEKFIKKEIKRYRPSFASVVVMDNNTGAIISALDFSRKTGEFGRRMTFSNTHPAASVFKIVTAADLFENGELDPSKSYSVNGKGTTLYKYQLKDKRNKWTRWIPFKSAFAFSNNPVIAKAAIKDSNAKNLYGMALKFGFHKSLMTDINLPNSRLEFPNSKYQLAELSSGFNKETLISPVHGALIASVIANEGVLKTPYLIKSVENDTGEEFLYSKSDNKIFSQETAEKLQSVMRAAVERGTARGAFRRASSLLKKDLEIGGKTGTITGGIPYGKRDWFVTYAKPVDDEEDKGISICVMLININKWYVKSSYLSRRIIEYYYKNQDVMLTKGY